MILWYQILVEFKALNVKLGKCACMVQPNTCNLKWRTDVCNVLHWRSLSTAHTTQVWTCMQVAWCSVICLSTVHGLIHRLLVHQSEANHPCGLVPGLCQCTEKQIYVVNLHSASRHSSLSVPQLAFAQVCSRLNEEMVDFCIHSVIFQKVIHLAKIL